MRPTAVVPRGRKRGTRHARWILVSALAIGFLVRPTEAEVKVKPVVNAQVLGGQYFYNGADSELGGFASLAASPYVEFNDFWSAVPLYSGSYKGTKQVADLIGGGTLFQDSQDHNFSTKVIRSFDSGLKVKAIGSYGFELLRETKDENWGSGLYDNRRASGGAEAEYDFTKDSWARLAYDYYKIRFPNYQSLSSQASSEGLGRELEGPNVLDSSNHAVTLSGQATVLWNGLVDGSWSRTYRAFGDQHIVDLSGTLTPETRDDHIDVFQLEGTWPVWMTAGWRLFGTLGYSRTHLSSNQNHYEASKFFFNSDYYGYTTNAIQTRWTALLGSKPWTVTAQGTVSRQNYSGRLVQDGAGTYGADTTHVDAAYATFGVAYPIAKGFSVEANASLGWNDSNNTYTKVYQYHYTAQTYLMGFSYAY